MTDVIGFFGCLGAAVLIRLYVINFVRVRGTSMRDTLQDGDFGLVWRLPYLFGAPHRGDVVICHYPGRGRRHLRWLPQDFVKRVIGLPGETVEIIEGTVHVCGEPLPEDYLNPACCRFRRSCPPRVLGADEYFVMGDNRDHSNDSRSVGPIRRRDIRGKLVCILLPFRRAARVR